MAEWKKSHDLGHLPSLQRNHCGLLRASNHNDGDARGSLRSVSCYLATGGSSPYGWSFYRELRKLNAKYVASHGTVRAMVQTGSAPSASRC